MGSSTGKGIYYAAAIVGSIIGSYLPTLFGVGYLSLWSLFGSVIGALVFIYLAYRFLG
jgi:uncharacterized membrane protein YeaQ/YmgE (transglycosylase-associated protein family)